MNKDEKFRNRLLHLSIPSPPFDRKYSKVGKWITVPTVLLLRSGINSFKISRKFRAIRCAIKSYIRFGCTNRNVKLRKLRGIKRGYSPRDVSRSIFTFHSFGEKIHPRDTRSRKESNFIGWKTRRVITVGKEEGVANERFDSRTFFISPSTPDSLVFHASQTSSS